MEKRTRRRAFASILGVFHIVVAIVDLIMYIMVTTLDPLTIIPEGFQNMEETPLVGLNNKQQTYGIDMYKGTIEGYDEGKGVKRGKCSPDEDNSHSCETLFESTSPIKITKWEGFEFTSSSLDSYYSYSNLLNLSVSSNEECPTDKKKCGILDTMNNTMCIDKDKQCPINLIIRSYTPEPPSGYSYNFSNITFSDKSYLYFTNEAIDKPIIAHFKITDEDPCINPNEYSSSYNSYVLDYYAYYGCNTTVNDTKYNMNYKYLDSMNKYTLYKDNGMLSSILFDDYKALLTIQTTSVYYSSFIGYNRECILKDNINVYNYSSYNKLKNISSFMTAILILVIVNGSFLIIHITIPFSLPKITIFLIDNITAVLFSIPFLVLVSISYSIFRGLNYNNSCSDKYTSLIFGYFNERKSRMEVYTLLMVIFHGIHCFLLIVIIIILIILLIKKKIKKKREMLLQEEEREKKRKEREMNADFEYLKNETKE